ncbi:MAG: hypothetical protein KDC38_00230 [Planctomycetes bacterium]|nr:hypothetical protein [Planctomycetota bacterium]
MPTLALRRSILLLTAWVWTTAVHGQTAPVSGLDCDPEPGVSITLSWVNHPPYDSIRILVDGEVAAQLPPSATQYTVTDIELGVPHTLGVAAVGPAGGELAAATCSGTLQDLRPANLTCTVFDGEDLLISWDNTATYDSIAIIVAGDGGSSGFSVPGDATSTLLPGSDVFSTAPYPASVTLLAVTPGLVYMPPTTCYVTYPGGPALLSITECEAVPETTKAFIAYDAEFTFDEFRVTVDGVQLLALSPLDDSSFTPSLGFGDHTLCVQAIHDGAVVAEACCVVDFPAPPPLDITCTPVAGTTRLAITWSSDPVYEWFDLIVDGAPVHTLPGDSTSYTTPQLGSGPHQVCFQAFDDSGGLVGSDCCQGTFPTPAGPDLVCAIVPGTTRIEVSWDALPAYAGYQVRVDGTVVGTLPGSTDSFTTPELGPGPHSICVRTFDGGGAIIGEDCCLGSFPVPPSPAIECTLQAENRLRVEWPVHAGYDTMEVSLDGATIGTAVAVAGFFVTEPLISGPHTVCVTAITSGGDIVGQDCCTGTVPLPEPPSDLVCVAEPGTAAASVAWTNHGAYEFIEVRVDGAPWLTLSGAAKYASLTGLGSGLHQICVGVFAASGMELGSACCTITITADVEFIRSDCNRDDQADVSDVVFLLGYLFLSGTPLECDDACDMNDDGEISITDAIFRLTGLFIGGELPPDPYPSAGEDPTADALGCG